MGASSRLDIIDTTHALAQRERGASLGASDLSNAFHAAYPAINAALCPMTFLPASVLGSSNAQRCSSVALLRQMGHATVPPDRKFDFHPFLPSVPGKSGSRMDPSYTVLHRR